MKVLRAGLIGANIQRTRLPFALKALCELNHIEFSFDLIDTTLLDNFDFDACVEQKMADGWSGVTVTHPYKVAAANYVGQLAGAPANMGASNTLIFNGGQSKSVARAYNTDYSGFVAAWQAELGDRKPGRVAMAGAGGVSRAIAIALIEMGAEELSIWDLEPERARDVARTADPAGTRAKAIPIEQSVPCIREADGLVNATAVGMIQYPGMAFDEAEIGSQKWAFDAVYTPVWTAFMEAAKSNNLTCFTGFSLFKHMAVRSFATYTGLEVSRADADRLIDPLADDI